MGKLDELRKMVGELFDTAVEKETIEKAAVVSNKIDEIEKEQEMLVKKNSELLNSYKELIVHTSFKDAPSAGNTPASSGTLDFNEMLNNFINNGGK